jgi:hypothetical protein
MALIVGTNSYIDADDADLYFADRLNSAVWTNSTTKDQALIQATKLIDNESFLGIRTNPTQPLSFPRFGIYLDGVMIDSNVVPQRVIDATCELAIWLLQSDYTAPDDLESYSRVQLGPIEVEMNGSSGGSKSLPPMVVGLLRQYKNSSMTLIKG